jgi:hypothetical protein
MIEAGLDKDEKVLCLEFNGWRFQGFEDAKIALIEGIVTGLLEKRPMLSKAKDAVKDVFQRIDWLKVAKQAGSLAITAHTGIPMQSSACGIEVCIDGRRPASRSANGVVSRHGGQTSEFSQFSYSQRCA